MKTFTFCTSFISTADLSHSFARYERWLKFYSGIMRQTGSDYLFIFDDGSPAEYLQLPAAVLDPDCLPETLSSPVNIVHFKNNLGRSSIIDYPGWWRSFLFAGLVARKYDFDKMIHAESDFFLTSTRMTSFVKQFSSGWVSAYSRYYDFAETAIQVICRDAFDMLLDVRTMLAEKNYIIGKEAEFILPFTKIEKTSWETDLGSTMFLQNG
jgi:hypothetical protein